MEELISVIIPVYRVEEYLDQCVRSVVEQTHRKLEIILVDDGSPDRCPVLCDQWAEKDSRIKVIHKENGGLSEARNAGLDAATGDYIAFVDSDDWLAPDMYRVMLLTLLREEADICACGSMVCYPDRQEPLPIPDAVGGPEEILALLYADTAYPVSAWNKLYRRGCWENFRFPVGKLCEDAFTTYLLVDRAQRIVQISAPLYHYRIRENSIMTTQFRAQRMDEEEAWRRNYEYMEIHHPRIRKRAFDFYLQKVNILIHTIPAGKREEFRDEYARLYGILKRNLWYILLGSGMRLKYRVKFLLDFIRLPS